MLKGQKVLGAFCGSRQLLVARFRGQLSTGVIVDGLFVVKWVVLGPYGIHY